MKNLLSPAVNKGDLRRLNYNKTVSAVTLPWTPLGELMMFSQTSESDGEEILPPPHSLFLVSGPKGASFSF